MCVCLQEGEGERRRCSGCLFSRLCNADDVIRSRPCALVPLITDSPWDRTKGGKLQKYTEGEWVEVAQSDRFKLTKPIGQVWLAMYTLIQEDECR